MDSVYTFWADITPLLDEVVYEKIYKEIPEFRREKAERIGNRRDQALSVGAWRLYMLAAKELGVSGEASFNLSHSGQYALVSIAPEGAKVGCDVEQMKAPRETLAKRFFSEEEYGWLVGQVPEKRAEAFYRLWVLKESFLKATRYGMKLGLDTFAFDMETAETPFLQRQPEKIREQYYFREAATGDGRARIAICSTCTHIEAPKKVELV